MTRPEPVRVLLAEDVRTDAELSVRELKRAGLRIEPRVVESEEDFRRALLEFRSDVILSDFSMPRFDGMQALALARELAPDVPFIFVSGTIGEEYAIRALKNGAVDYVLKSNLLRLPPAVERALEEARERAVRRKMERKLARLNRIRDLASAVNAAIVRLRDRQQLFDAFCRIAVEKGKFVAARLVEFERASDRLRIAVVTDDRPDSLIDVVEAYNADPGGSKSLLALALRDGRPVVSNDASADERARQRGWFARDGVNSVACLPLFVEGKAVGAVVLRAAERGFFDDEELRLLDELTANLSFALELMEKQAKLDYLAYYDPLTGLPNRALFGDRLAQAIETARSAGHKAAVLVFDIERFKTINDSLGTSAGDAVLQHISKLAVEAAGGAASLARLGGDQFALLLAAVRDAEHAGHLLEKPLASMLDMILEHGGRELRVAAKAGIALYPEDGADADALLRNAEAALKKAKATGERFVYYAPHLNARVAERLDLETKLRRAVERGEFVLHFQPRVDLGSQCVMGLEALLRWPGAETGMKSPALFVPVLEETGLIHQVGRWAMREAVATHRAWAAKGLAAPRIAVNVSAVQLRSRDFVEEVRAALEGAGPAGLDLEITESLLMQNIEESLRKLREIRDMGVSIALDDFGTGYSSLGYLSKLPIDTLKIDRSFIRSMTEKAEDTSIVTAILSLARSLNLKVVAEGVETEQQAQLLRLLRCDQMQGYLFSPPVSGEKVESLLAIPRN